MALTTQFNLNVGVNAGYGHQNQTAPDVVGPIWQEEAGRVFRDTGVYVGAVITPGSTVYHTDWGCPVGGERTAAVNGLRNPQFISDDAAWRVAVRLVARAVGNRLGQKTLYLTFLEIVFEYIVEIEIR